MSNPRPWLACQWQTPGVESIDPLREGKAYLDQINGLLRSPQEVTARRGRDYEDVLNEIAEAKRMADARGLSPLDVKTALASAPGSVVDEPPATSAKRDEMELVHRALDVMQTRDAQPAAVPVVNITNNMPEQAAPVVNVTNNLPELAAHTTVNVPDQPAPVVNTTVNVPESAAPAITVNVPAPTIKNEVIVHPQPARELVLKKDASGNTVGAVVK
jgi:hypothetical protein